MTPIQAEKLHRKIWREMPLEIAREKRKLIWEFLKKLNKIGRRRIPQPKF